MPSIVLRLSQRKKNHIPVSRTPSRIEARLGGANTRTNKATNKVISQKMTTFLANTTSHDHEQDCLLLRQDATKDEETNSIMKNNKTTITIKLPSSSSSAHNHGTSVLHVVRNNNTINPDALDHTGGSQTNTNSHGTTHNCGEMVLTKAKGAAPVEDTPTTSPHDAAHDHDCYHYRSTREREGEGYNSCERYGSGTTAAKARVVLSKGIEGERKDGKSSSFYPSKVFKHQREKSRRRDFAAQEKQMKRHIAANKNLTRQNITFFNEETSPRNSTSSVLPLPASPSISSTSSLSAAVYAIDTSTPKKFGKGERKSMLLSQKKQSSTTGRSEKSTGVSNDSCQEVENAHLTKSSAGKTLKFQTTQKYYSQDTTIKTPRKQSATTAADCNASYTDSTPSLLHGDYNHSVQGSDCSLKEENIAVTSNAMAPHCTNLSSFFVPGQNSFQRPYTIQQSNATSSFTDLPQLAHPTAPIPGSANYDYYSNIIPQNGVGLTNFLFQHHNPHNCSITSGNTEELYKSCSERGLNNRTTDMITSAGAHCQQYYRIKNIAITPPPTASHNLDYTSEKHLHHDHPSSNMAHMIPCFNSHGHLVSYVMAQHSSTSNSTLVPFIQHGDPSSAAVAPVHGYYFNTNNPIVHPTHHRALPSSRMSSTYQTTAGGGRVARGLQSMSVHHHEEHCLNHHAVHHLQEEENNFNCDDLPYQQDGSKPSQKRDLDNHLSSNRNHRNTETSNCYKHTGDDSFTGGSMIHDLHDTATKKRKLLAKLEREKPRRPLTAYNFFFSEERERIIAEMSSKDEVATITFDRSDKNASSSTPLSHSSTQGEGDDMDKNLVSNGDKELQTCKSSSIIASDLEEKIQIKTEKLLSSRRQCDRPKRSHKKEHGKVSFQVLCTLVGKRWKALSVEKKHYYIDLSKRDLERYREDMKDYARKRARAVETCFGDVDTV